LHNEGGVKLRKGKKPEKLISRIVELCTNKGDLVLDFFAGSGTTGTVCLKMDRKFIITEQLEYIDSKLIKRLKNTIGGEQSGISKAFQWKGGGNFKYAELFRLNENFMESIQDVSNKSDMNTLWSQMKEHAFLSYQINPSDIDENVEEFEALSLTGQKKFLVEVLDKNQLYVNYSEMDNGDYEVSESDKKLNHQFYQLSEP